jgi:hypothetical protein
MKIICVDNFDHEIVSDYLVCENINMYYGECVVEYLNNKFSGEHLSSFYRLVPDNYKLFVFEP